MRRALVAAVAMCLIAGACSKPEPEGTAGVCERAASVPDEGQGHAQPPAKVTYKSDPPTSGQHYSATSRTGVFESAPPVENLVHNLEHGHVIIWYRPDALRGAVLDALTAEVKRDESRVVLAPRDTPFPDPATVAVFTSWGRMQRCTAPTNALAADAREFIRRYAGAGPEGDIPGNPNR